VVPVPPDAAAGADPDDDAEELPLDGELLQALATASVRAAMAMVPYLAGRHRPPVNPFVGRTCSYLLTSKSCDDPGQEQPSRGWRDDAC
jgi:hypothetical protein